MLCIRYPEFILGHLDSLTNFGHLSHSFLTKTIWHSVKILDPFVEDKYTDQLHLPLRWTYCLLASLEAQTVKNLPAIQETWIWFLGWEDLEKGMATHSSILAWKIPWNLLGYSPWDRRVGQDWATNTYYYCLLVTESQKKKKSKKFLI